MGDQLPYHPQFLWRNTHFNAPLSQDSSAPDVVRPTYDVEKLHGMLPEGTLRASLMTSLSSGRDHRGDVVDGVITRPFFSADKTKLIVPEGAVLHGRWFVRSPRDGLVAMEVCVLRSPLWTYLLL
ncbi:hypothetical protein [Terriglobus roseus]|uniref:hypothetical protein n=1 Tax=Terriglobus roseus TaxID=392734 RepID=UPI0012EAA5C6|nr:hypothetical protein [Terriglobus roseus]